MQAQSSFGLRGAGAAAACTSPGHHVTRTPRHHVTTSSGATGIAARGPAGRHQELLYQCLRNIRPNKSDFSFEAYGGPPNTAGLHATCAAGSAVRALLRVVTTWPLRGGGCERRPSKKGMATGAFRQRCSGNISAVLGNRMHAHAHAAAAGIQHPRTC